MTLVPLDRLVPRAEPGKDGADSIVPGPAFTPTITTGAPTAAFTVTKGQKVTKEVACTTGKAIGAQVTNADVNVSISDMHQVLLVGL